MKKIIFLGFVLFLVGCNKTTETPTTIAPTTEVTTDLVTSSISDEIYLYLVPGIDTVEINSTWVDMKAYFVINDVEYEMTTTSTVDSHERGVNEIIYTYEYEDMVYQITRFVAVLDQTPPVLSLNPGVDTITIGSNWVDTGIGII